MYDSSIHLGQFSLNEDIRVRCKNAQVVAKTKQQETWVIAVVTFCENTESDHCIRETLGRKEQDVFYPRMDVYHTIKQIEKVRDNNSDVRDLAAMIQQKSWSTWSAASILAWAVTNNCKIINTLYTDVLQPSFVKYAAEIYDITIQQPPLWPELPYTWGQLQEEDGKHFDLETLYQEAMNLYRQRNIDLLENLLRLQQQEGR